MGKTYDQDITESEVSLGIEQLLIGPETATYDPEVDGIIDIDSPPTGFTHLGAVVEDTPTMTVTREKYQLKLGLPKGIKYEAVIGIEGSMELTVWAKSNNIVEEALGVDKVTLTAGTGTRLPLGTTTLNKFHILGVADFIDGSQVVHDFPKVTPKAEYVEEIRPDEAGKVVLGFDAYSYTSATHGNDLIVGERYYFTTTTTTT